MLFDIDAILHSINLPFSNTIICWLLALLSWFEAGPFQWFSPGGYNHQNVGIKVSQIQAVLARRCENAGELQQQLLKANWNYGVAQWGVLGQFLVL